MSVEVLKEKDYEEKVANETALVIIDFFKPGCGPCQALAPVIEELTNERKDVKFFSVNIEEEPSLASRLRVMAAPSLLFIKEGTVKKKTLGFKSKESLDEIINILLT